MGVSHIYLSAFSYLASVAHEFGDSFDTRAPGLLGLPDDVCWRIVSGTLCLRPPHLWKINWFDKHRSLNAMHSAYRKLLINAHHIDYYD